MTEPEEEIVAQTRQQENEPNIQGAKPDSPEITSSVQDESEDLIQKPTDEDKTLTYHEEWDLTDPNKALPLEHIEKYFNSLEDSIQKLRDEFQSKLKYDAHKEKIIDTLHAELQTYKNGLLDKLVRPIILDIIEVIDDTRKIMRDLKAKELDNDPNALKKIVLDLPGDLEDLLYKHGIEAYASDSPAFTPATQKAIKIIPTEDQTLDKMICDRLKNGYQSEGKLIRQEMVSVYQFQKKNS